MPGPSKGSGDWNGNNSNSLSSNNWRESLVPAAAVIPAPIVYIKAVAIKKLVVGNFLFFFFFCSTVFFSQRPLSFLRGRGRRTPLVIKKEKIKTRWGLRFLVFRLDYTRGTSNLTLKKLECSKQANTARFEAKKIFFFFAFFPFLPFKYY